MSSPDYEDDFEDYSSQSGFLGWIGRDPLLRVCVLTEVFLWIFFSCIASCCFCVLRRKFQRTRPHYYSPTSTSASTSTSTSASFVKDGQREGSYELDQTNNNNHGRVRPMSDINDNSTSTDESCKTRYLVRHLVPFVICVVVGFISMVIVLVTVIPFLMPNALFIPDSCNDADWCQSIPGAENLFVTTASGNNVSLRLFPAKTGGKYYLKRLSVMYSNPNAGYTTRGYEVYEKLSSFGISVYAWDYPGYMLSSGHPTYASVLEAGEAVLQLVAAHSFKNLEDVVLLGRSLGGAVSIALAQKHNSKALVLLNSLDSLQLLLGDCCVLSGWASSLHYASGHFDAAESLASFDGCLFQYAAENDAIVYFQRQRRLFFEDSVNKRKVCSVFVKGNCLGHNDDQWEQGSFVKALNVYFQKLDI